jgi:hypothetical protein
VPNFALIYLQVDFQNSIQFACQKCAIFGSNYGYEQLLSLTKRNKIKKKRHAFVISDGSRIGLGTETQHL